MKKLAYLVLTLFVFTSCKSEIINDVVSVSSNKILVSNTPYVIKGICYHPVPKGSPNKRSFATLTQDLALMTEAGINTIRVYAPINDVNVLDEISQAGIKVIIGFGYNQKGNYDIKSGTFIDYVNTYKNHSAILMWELGNEYNYHPQWFDNDIKNWYEIMNEAAGLIHRNDSSHPTTTAHGDLPDALALSMSPNIDVWGMNVYRWDDPEPIFKEWEAMSSKPMYLSETGGDSYMKITKAGYEQGENQKAQADAAKNILKKVFDNQDVCLGVTLFSFTDGWWKAGNNSVQDIGGYAPNSTGIPYDGAPNEEYWGIVDIDRNKKQVFNVVKETYLSKTNK
ncbi:glycoside hydrolase 5 family protein [Psychroserpens luteus]|uniref:Glycoside hydrolase family 2 TIM barrel-domain containing protein n=1 Tax=Psychroserpens luteus TaxID=1434066 RepID=A0ABW5ZNF7_9FLAO|nr:glycoside hydrolase family 2 TIM barrel-domain containing protein [Psychroserpens luteus]